MKVRKSKIALIAISSVMLTSGVVASVAWFLPTTNAFSARITGNVVEEYFHCGSGTQADPFVITRPIHYYHLTEFFQRETTLPTSNGYVTFGSDYLYFQVGYPLKDNDSTLYVYDYDNTGTYTGTVGNPAYSKTLNMSYFSNDNALMPIGSNEVPFFGSFDGGASDDADEGITIDNLNICTSSSFKEGQTTINRSTSDAGVFGFVADQDGSSHQTVIKNAYFNNLTIDLTGMSSSGTSASTHTPAHADNALYVGYVVGHMQTYTTCDVSMDPDTGVLTNTNDSSPLHDVYVNNAKMVGGAGVQNHFGYVGFADTIDGENGGDIDLAEMIADLKQADGGGQGQGSNWGGSINFKDFNLRLKDQLTNGETVATGTYVRFRKYTNNYLDVSAYHGSQVMTNVVNKDPTTTRVIYNLLGKGDHTVKISAKNYTANMPGTVEPILMAENSYSEPDADNNTGYIVSATSSGTAGTIRSASYELRFIANALGDSTYESYQVNSGTNNGYTGGTALSFPSYDKTKFEVLTNSSTTYGASNYYFIKDELTGYNSAHTPNYNYTKSDATTPASLSLTKYNNSRQTLDSILNNASYVHGMHFMGTTVSYDKYVQRNNLKILGETMPNNYKLPTSAIDFNLKEDGKINLFAGSYYSHGTPTKSGTRYDGDSDSFFTLYHINRSSGDLVNGSIKKISKIFKNTDTSVDAKYVYQYSDNTNSSGTKGDAVFDLAYLEHCPVNNAVYYFEIPVNSGEYALGAVSGSTAGAYLMYLDIGASGEAEEQDFDTENRIATTPIFTQMDCTSSGFVVNTCFNIAYVIPAGADKETFSITISRSGNIYSVVVVNTTSAAFNIDILLVDNDGEPDNDNYPFTYTLTYNGGGTDTYNYSASFSGVASGTSLVPQ